MAIAIYCLVLPEVCLLGESCLFILCLHPIQLASATQQQSLKQALTLRKFSPSKVLLFTIDVHHVVTRQKTKYFTGHLWKLVTGLLYPV